MKNITNKTKTILFASLIAALILPFSVMDFAEGQEIPIFVKPIELRTSMSQERQAVIDQIEIIGYAVKDSKTEQERLTVVAQLDPLKADMKRLGLTPTFDFGEDRDTWNENMDGVELIRVTSETIRTGGSHTDNWHVKHKLTWGCNIFTYCQDYYPEWYDLGDWSAITITLGTVNQSYLQLNHYVTNFTGGSATENMEAWGTHTRGTTVLSSSYDNDLEFWTDHEVESETVMASWNVQTGDKVYSTSRIT